jgi:acyl-CoA thioesterase
MTEFDDALALTPIEGTDGEVGGVLGEGWLIGDAINGGVLMALGARAMGEAVAAAGGASDVLAFSAYFLSAGQPGPVSLAPTVLRVGRNFSTAQVSIRQPGSDGAVVERVRMLATVADVSATSEPVHRQQEPPVLPPPQECIPTTLAPRELTDPIRILRRLDLRIDPATAGFGMGAPTGEGELRGWIRFIDGRAPDLLALPFFLDAFPPVAFDLGAMGWAPTIEFSGHVRAVPAPGWLRVRLTTPNVSGGLLEEDCVIWDSTGRVVAQSRQLAGVRMPSAPGAA